MTYDEWFRSKQGVPYEGAYVFAQDAWTYQGDTIAELRAELAESDALREKLAKLLAETAVALKGEEAALHRHSWHDLPVVALAAVIELAEARSEVDELLVALEQLAGQLSHVKNDTLLPSLQQARLAITRAKGVA